jgi:hypothetical protein
MFIFILGVIYVLFVWTIILEPALSIIVNIKKELLTECGTAATCTPTDPCTPDYVDGVIGASWAVAACCFLFFVVLLLTFVYSCRSRKNSSSFLRYTTIGVAILTWVATIAFVVYAATVIKTPIAPATLSVDLKQCSVRDGAKYIRGAFYALAAATLLVLSSGSIQTYVQNIFKRVEEIDEESVSITSASSQPAKVEDLDLDLQNNRDVSNLFSSMYSNPRKF